MPDHDDTEAQMRAVLRKHTTEALVDAVIQLTHRIHSAMNADHQSIADGLRLQRSLVRDELIRRATPPAPRIPQQRDRRAP